MEGKRIYIKGGSKGGTTGAPRTAWRVFVGQDQYGGFANREEAELEATRRRALGAATVKVFEVWHNPHEHVVGVAECERCGERMPRFDGRVVNSPASIVCGPCSVETFGHWDEEPTTVECWPVERGCVDQAGEYEPPKRHVRSSQGQSPAERRRRRRLVEGDSSREVTATSSEKGDRT